jgi:hypothetical protein
MAFPVKQVRALEELLRITEEEEEKIPSEKRTDIAKQLGLPPSSLNTIIVKKKNIREHAIICGLGACDAWCAVWKKCVVSWEVKLHGGGARWWWL